MLELGWHLGMWGWAGLGLWQQLVTIVNPPVSFTCNSQHNLDGGGAVIVATSTDEVTCPSSPSQEVAKSLLPELVDLTRLCHLIRVTTSSKVAMACHMLPWDFRDRF